MRLFRNNLAVVWLFGLIVTVPFWAFTWLGVGESGFQRLHTLVFDNYQRLKPRQWGGSDILIVDIDEASIAKFGQWPWPRSTIAKMTDRLGELGAATIVFDIVFSEPDRTSPINSIKQLQNAGASVELPQNTKLLDNDQLLAESFARNRVVAGVILSPQGSQLPPPPKVGVGFSGTPPPGHTDNKINAIRNLPFLDEAATGIGNFGLSGSLQSDAVIRRVELLTPANNAYYPSLAMETLRVVQGAGGFKLKSSDGSGEYSGGELTIVSAQVGALEVPTGPAGELEIYHSPSAQKTSLPAASILSPKDFNIADSDLSAAVANHIVLVGTSAPGLLDLRSTPLEPVVPGVFIHADIIDQIIAGSFLNRPDTAPGIELLVAMIGTALILFLLPFLNPLNSGLLTLVSGTAVILSFWYAFSEYRLLLSPVVPLLSLALAYAAGLAANLLVTEKQGRFVRNAFAHYLSPAMVERLADNPDALKLGGEEKELTVLFCDIRGFTSLSEGLDPTELTELLNDFLTPMTTELLDRGATIDKYMGDAIMAFWNAPIDQADHAQRACEGALAMREALKTLNSSAPRKISIGIGLNSGACCVGNLGSSQRFNYSAIGDAVNVASRIEGLTKQYAVDNLIAEETLLQTKGFITLEVDKVGVVGREQALTVHTIISKSDEETDTTFEKLAEAHAAMLDAYRLGDIEEAIVSMTKAKLIARDLDGFSLDMLYAVYSERFAHFRETGIPNNWDGVYRASSK